MNDRGGQSQPPAPAASQLRLRCHTVMGHLVRSLPRFRGVTTVGRAITRGLMGGRDVAPAMVSMRDGTRMLLDTRSRMELSPFWTGDYEVPVLRFLKTLLVPGSVLLDVGANIGFVAVACGHHLRSIGGGRVLAFEPVGHNYARLVENIAINNLQQVVTAYEVGLGEREEELPMMTETTGASTGNAVLTSALVEGDNFGVVSHVRIARLDDLPLDVSRVDVVKVDIEGAEVMFMRGGRGLLARHRPVIFGEFNACFIARFGHSVRDAFDIVSPLRYDAFRLTRDGRLHRIDQIVDGMMDLVFVPQESTAHRLVSNGLE